MEIQDIAVKLGVHRGTVFHWLSGARSPNKENMLKIQEELGWPIEDQMTAYNTVIVGEINPRGKPADDYGASFRAFLEKKYDIPPANPGRTGPRS